jgi:hypothetical protein
MSEVAVSVACTDGVEFLARLAELAVIVGIRLDRGDLGLVRAIAFGHLDESKRMRSTGSTDSRRASRPRCGRAP